jgi:hypothetical protein
MAGTTRLDTDTFEYDAFADPAVGAPTKLSELQRLKEDIEHAEEAAVQGRTAGSDAQCRAELNGFALLQCNFDITKDSSKVIVDASANLPFDTSDADKLNLRDRLIYIRGWVSAVISTESETKLLPGGEWDAAINAGSTAAGPANVDRAGIDLVFFSGPGQALYSTGNNWRANVAEYAVTSTDGYTLYFYVDDTDGDLHARWQKTDVQTANDHDAAILCFVTIGPRMTHYVAP